MTDWQPIETAPRDGTRILVFREDWVEDIAVCYWLRELGEFIPIQGTVFIGATHWMPTPPPPKVTRTVKHA